MPRPGPPPVKAYCKNCSKPFEKKWRWSKYCSEKCKNDYHNFFKKERKMNNNAPHKNSKV